MESGNKINILMVEDEMIIALATTMALKEFHYEIINAYNGEDAVKMAVKNVDINLILMDINLGNGMDGTEAAKQILLKRNIPIIFLTSHNEQEYVNKVKNITRYGYVMKNSDIFVLQSSIEMAYDLFNAISIEKNEQYSNFNKV
ncbi:MAG: response regulator [Spirochaetes bacterium]|nr:response regulator [Spirochaetota bacterium]